MLENKIKHAALFKKKNRTKMFEPRKGNDNSVM